MDNPDKTSSLFTQHSDRLTGEQKEELKKVLRKHKEITVLCGRMSLHFIILGLKNRVYMTHVLIQWMKKVNTNNKTIYEQNA